MTIVAVAAVVADVDVWLLGLSKPSLGQIGHYAMVVVVIIANKAAVVVALVVHVDVHDW